MNFNLKEKNILRLVSITYFHWKLVCSMFKEEIYFQSTLNSILIWKQELIKTMSLNFLKSTKENQFIFLVCPEVKQNKPTILQIKMKKCDKNDFFPFLLFKKKKKIFFMLEVLKIIFSSNKMYKINTMKSIGKKITFEINMRKCIFILKAILCFLWNMNIEYSIFILLLRFLIRVNIIFYCT